MREFEIVEHTQIDGLRVFFDTVRYRTPHIHREFELIWLLDGALDVRIERALTHAQPGDMALFNPGQMHEFLGTGRGCTFLCVQVSPALVRRAYPAMEQLRFSQPWLQKALDSETFRGAQRRLLALTRGYLARGDGYELACTGQICLLLAALVAGVPHEVLTDREIVGQRRRSDRLLRLMRYVDENYMRKVSLSEFARQEGLSMSYLSHFVRGALGQSFQAYVDNVRFSAACAMIASGRTRMVDVYAACGFSDYRYFSQAFKKRLGVTPEAYSRSAPREEPRSADTGRSAHSLERFYSRQESLALLAHFSPADS